MVTMMPTKWALNGDDRWKKISTTNRPLWAVFYLVRLVVVYIEYMPYNQISNQKEAIMAKKEIHKLFMNMDKKLHTQIKEEAKKDRRNVSDQIHALLYEILEQRNGKA